MEPSTIPSVQGMNQPPTLHPHEHRKRAIVIWSLVALLVIAGAIWHKMYKKTERPLDPMEQLQQLDAASQPVTKTPQQQYDMLNAHSKDKVNMSQADQLKKLEALGTIQ